MLITYGFREKEQFEALDVLIKEGILPDNRNEIVRRGIHATRYLAEVDEYELMELLSENLHFAIKNKDEKAISRARSLAFAIYAAMIVKHGLLKVELFESIPMQLDLIKKIDRSKVEIKDEDIINNLKEMATSLDTIFLKQR
ncbi:MAG: hypothetical protein D6752_07165, partial [Candidatus Nitrosothermus koennekii]